MGRALVRAFCRRFSVLSWHFISYACFTPQHVPSGNVRLLMSDMLCDGAHVPVDRSQFSCWFRSSVRKIFEVSFSVLRIL